MFRPVIAALLLLAAIGAEAGPAYVPGTEDVPLMPGLTSVADSQLVFDKPQGRIIQISARGVVHRADVLAFYGQSLPSLGWRRLDAQHFQREGELLSFDFDGKDGDLTVAFTLRPH